jgi:two-component system nitrate/nitrite response regulator NarL
MDRTTVIVADDSELFRGSLTRSIKTHPQLELLGRASDGEGALELIAQVEPDVAIVDIRMPKLGGEELVRHVTTSPLKTRMLMLSAHIDEAVIGRVLGAGAAGCMSKDDPEAEIVMAILDIADGRTVISTSLQPLLAAHFAHEDSPVRLSPREQEVLELSSRGKSAKQIARELVLSQETVNTLLQRAARKLDASGKTHAVAEAIRRGFL